MKEKIISIIAYLSLLLIIVSMFAGVSLWKVKISSIRQIKDKNEEVIEKIEETEKVVSEDYPKAKTKLEDTYKEYTTQKQKYIELAGISNDSDKGTYETKQYDITYLWKKIGSYATNRNLAIGISVQKNTSSLYDLNFTVKGEYTDISDFIVDIEEDSEFNFRIYNFKMVASDNNKNIIIANFSTKNINIDSSTIS